MEIQKCDFLTHTMLDNFIFLPLLPNFCPMSIQDSFDWHALTSRVENSVDPDQLVSRKPADLDLQCF